MAEKDENLVSMENELFVKQVAKRGIGQGSRVDHPATEIASTTSKESISINAAIKISSREKRLKTLREAAAEESPTKSNSKIQRVPLMLRDHKNFDKYCEPRVVALGPFHHGKPKYEPAETVKLKLAANFVRDSEQKDEDLLKKIEENIKQLRECYEKEATKDYDDEALAWMMFVDGCSTLEFIYKYQKLEEFKIKRDQVAFVEQDMFLLENQLPYRVLKLLISSSDKREDLKNFIKNFVDMHSVAVHLKPSTQSTEQNQQEHTTSKENVALDQKPSTQSAEQKQQSTGQQEHTISMETVALDQKPSTQSVEQNQQSTGQQEHTISMETVALDQKPSTQSAEQNQQSTGQQEEEPVHLLDMLRTTMLGCPNSKRNDQNLAKKKKRNDQNDTSNSSPQSFRNVQELKAAGIHFRISKESCLRDISFKPSYLCGGFLYLPRIKVDDSMGPKFMNLIAYEMCPDFENDFGVTSYIGFLDSLIDHADDVKHLRKKYILQNLLGSDDEVAILFNVIGTDLVPNPDIYRYVKTQIEDHYQTKWKTWMAQFFHDHFSSPWTFLAFIGALVGLGLSGIATWYTVYEPSSK